MISATWEDIKEWIDSKIQHERENDVSSIVLKAPFFKEDMVISEGNDGLIITNNEPTWDETES